ncbi:MAG: undecaprenyldiphospho-muramoylpentapeptide beta-N-acetylglucosaminyltransferase [Bacteroidia bacterium]|nr:undecaprenyldiphospho-muramoylpentapeptide beta-N-acetylglucosaminyltransferase [Bacteroidia bacterium]
MRVIISGGGTGGHIFPAIAIANALKALDSSTDILFVGAEGKMEMEKVPAAGYTIQGLPIAGIKRELSLDNLSFPFKLIRSLRKAAAIIREFKPDVAVGVGGYASGPLLYMASRQGIPALIQEQNSYPGITNKLLARRAAKICVAYEQMDRFFPAAKIVFTGNPVREDIRQIEGKRGEAAAFFGLSPDVPTLLVVGGSQGARSINRAIRDGLKELDNAGIQVLWQTGKLFGPEAQAAVAQLHSKRIKAMDFISRMDLAYALSDAVVTRAGASTVSELCIVRKPSIMVPLPTAAEDHQTKNCLALVERQAALLVPDAETAQRLVNEALKLIQDKELCRTLAENMSVLARPLAAQDIAREVIQLVKK